MIGLPPIAVAAIGVVVACAGSAWWGYDLGSERVQAQWDAERLAAAAAVQRSTEQARAAEHAAQQSISALKERTNETLRSIHARHRADLDRLRQQSRDGGADLSAGAGAVVAGCADPRVAAGDGGLVVGARDLDLDFPIHFAADAAQVAAALDECRAWAGAVTQLINRGAS